MGRTLQAVIERRAAEDAPWSFHSAVEYTDRHSGFYDDLDACCSFYRCGEAINPLTVMCLSEATGGMFELRDWTNAEHVGLGLRCVTRQQYLEVLAKWRKLPPSDPDALDSHGLQLIGAALIASQEDAGAFRVLYWYDDAPFEDVEQVLHDRARERATPVD
jgi:hypothetical protein